MEPYITLGYSIKPEDIRLLKHEIREVCIIFEALST